MKNLSFLLMMFVGLAFMSCEPMEDIHNDLDERLDNRPVEGIGEYTLTADDYDELGLEAGNFDNLDDAAALIPGLLSENFQVWGEGSLAQVTFDLNAPISPVEYTMTEAGYAAIGLDMDYFATTSQIKEFLTFQFPQANTNDYVELTYRTVAVEQEFTFTADDFEEVGAQLDDTYPDPASSAAQYKNFDRREGRDAYWSNDMILDAINVVMEENFEGIEGQTYKISYAIYDGDPGVESMSVRYNGTSYEVFGATAYEITRDDYDFIGEELGEAYPGPAGNAAQYNSFDIRSTSDNYWTEDMILEAVAVVLMERYPSAAEGDKFDITYDTYDGDVKTVIESVILEDGTYVVDESSFISTVMETTVFARGDGTWNVPISLPEATEDSNIYEEVFQQSNPNFGNEATAGFYIGRWLEPQFPYAQEGDFVSVEYRFYDRELRQTVDRFGSFIYTDREWVLIPSVIPQTLQFGYEETGWVVDNTIVYTLSSADYELIGEALADEYPDPAWSVGNYENFDRRPGNVNQWKDAMLLEAFNILLNQKVAPNAEEGQKYLLTFDIYNGTNTTEQFHLIKTDGVWIPVE